MYKYKLYFRKFINANTLYNKKKSRHVMGGNLGLCYNPFKGQGHFLKG